MTKLSIAKRLLKLAVDIDPSQQAQAIDSDLLVPLLMCCNVHTPDLAVLLDKALEKGHTKKANDHTIIKALIDCAQSVVIDFIDDEAMQQQAEKLFKAYRKSARSAQHIKDLLNELLVLELDSGMLEDFLGSIEALSDTWQDDPQAILHEMKIIVNTLNSYSDIEACVKHVLEQLAK